MTLIRQSICRNSRLLNYGNLVRFNSHLSTSQTILPHEQSKLQLLANLSKNENNHNFKLLQRALKNRDEIQVSELSKDVLNNISISKNDPVFISSLNTIQSQHIDQQIIDKILQSLPLLIDIEKTNQPIYYSLHRFIKLSLIKDPELVSLLEASLLKINSKGSISLLLSIYLQTKQLNKGYLYIQHCFKKNIRVAPVSIEILLHHLIQKEQISKAANIIELTWKNNYVLYQRTLGPFLSKAIEMGDVSTCLKFYKQIVSNGFVDNGSLINLIELLNDELMIKELKDLYTLLVEKSSLSPDIAIRYKRCLVESRARRRGFHRAFATLESDVPFKLKVADYPQLLKTVAVSAKLRKVEFVLLKRINYYTSMKLKRFYINLVLAKLAENGSVELGLEVLHHNKALRFFLDEESMLYIIKGVIYKPDIFIIDSMVRTVLDSKVSFTNEFIIDNLLKLVVESTYWYNVFELYKRIRIKNYKMDERLYKLLKFKSEHNGFHEQFKDIECA